MNEIVTKKDIESKIYEIRGVQVMLSSDVAKLYHVETKALNQTIKRNIKRFPSTFCFQLTIEEMSTLYSRSQIVTLNKSNDRRGFNLKYNPYVLTEQGIMMLSGLLKSDIAVEVNVKIINAFVNMRKYISNNLIEQKYINNLVIKNDERLTLVENTLNKLNEKQKINSIFFEGQIFDAYYVLMNILNEAKREIIIIDNYAGRELFKLLKGINKNIIIITSNINEVDYKKYNEQYSNITIKTSNSFHDRFILIDKKILYHSGTSFKDLGKKCFAIQRLEDEKIISELINEIDK